MLGLDVSSFTLDCPTPSAAAETSEDPEVADSEVDDLHDDKTNNINTKRVRKIRVMIINFIGTKYVVFKILLYAYNHKVRPF